MRWTLKNKILFGFGLNWLASVVLGLLGYVLSTYYTSYIAQAQDAHTTRDQYDDLMTNLVEASAAQRGYIITGDETQRTAYQHTLLQIESRLDIIREAVTPVNPQTTPGPSPLSRLEDLIAQRILLLETAIQVRQADGFEAAQPLVGTAEGERLMTEIATLLNELEEDETQALSQRTAQIEQEIQNTLILISFGTLLTLSLAIFGGIGITNRIDRSISVLKKGVNDLATGRLEQPVPIISHDEIAEVTVAFNDMATRLHTALVEKAKSQALFQSLFEASPDAVLVVNRLGAIVFANTQTELLTGYTRETLRDMQINTLIPDRFRTAHANLQTDYVTQPRPRAMGTDTEFFLLTRTGNELPVDIMLNTLPNEAEPLILCVVRDITERKQAEKDLQTANQALEQRVEERTAELARSEAEYRALTDNALVGVYRATLDGVLRYANEATAYIFRFASVADLMQQTAVQRYKNPSDRTRLIEQLQHTGRIRNLELDMVTAQGDIITVLTSVRLEGTIIYGMLIDITERKRAEATMREIAENMAMAQRIGHFGSWEIGLSPDLGFIDPRLWSDECYRIIGVEPGSVESTAAFFYNLVHPEDRDQALAILHQTIRDGTEAAYEYRILRPDGTLRYLRDQVNLVRDEGGRPIKIVGLVQDLTEQKQAEEALRASETRYQALFEDVPVAIWEEDFSELKRHLDTLKTQGITDLRAYFASHPEEYTQCANLIRVVDVNHTALKMFKAETKSALIQFTYASTSLGEQAHNIEDFIAIAEGKSQHGWEGADETLTGVPIEISLHWSVAPGHEADYSRVIVTTEDITLRKQAEQALKDSEQRLQLALTATNLGVWEWEISSNHVYWSPECYVISGLQAFDDTFDAFRRLIHPEDVEMVSATIQQALHEKRIFSQEYRIIRPNGEVIWVSNFGLIQYDAANEPRGMIGTVQDITERKQTELALIDEKIRLDKVAASVPGLLSSFRIAADGTSKVVYASPMIQAIYGLTEADVAENANLYTNRVHPDDLPVVLEGMFRSAQTLQPWISEYRYQHPAKGEIWLEGHSMPVREPDGSTLWHGFIYDITERKQTAKSIQIKDDLLRLTGDMAKVGGWEFDPNTLKGTWTDEVARIHDLDPTQEIDLTLGLSFYSGEMRAKIEKAIQEAINLKRGYDLELTMLTGKGNPKWVRTMGLPIIEGDRVVKVRGIFQDITERKQAEARLKAYTDRIILLAEASRAFAEASLVYGITIERIVQHIAKALGDMCILYIMNGTDEGEELLIHHDPDSSTLAYSHSLLSNQNITKGLTLFSQQTLESSQPQIIPHFNLEEYRSSLQADFRLLLEPIGIHSLIVAPLNFSHQTIGVIYFIRHQPDLPSYTEADLTLARDLADRAALAITNARLFNLVEKELFKKAQAEEEVRLLNVELEQRVTQRTEELRAALNKTETLYTLARAAVESENQQEALQEVVSRVAVTLPAYRVVLLTFDLTQKKVIHLVRGGPGAAYHTPNLTFEDWMEGLTGWVMREGKAILSSKDHPDPRESLAVQQRRARTQAGSVAVAPLRFLEQNLGTLTVINHPDDRDFSEADLELLEAVANQAAGLLVRISLYERLQNTNLGLQAEIAERKLLEIQIRQNEARAQALADVSQALAEVNLDHTLLFGTIAHKVSNLLGDSCYFSLISKDGHWLEPLAFYHTEPEGLAYIKHLLGEGPLPVQQNLVGQVAQTGNPILLPQVSRERIRELIQPEFWAYQDRYGPGSVLIVPLRARNRVIGTLGVSRDQPGKPFTHEDQTFLQDLGDRVGLAIENNRLFLETIAAREEADHANLAKSEFLSRMSHELRTPLNAILGFAQIFAMDDLDDKQNKAIQHILRAGKHLLGLINEVLDITRIEVGKLSISPESIRVKEVIEETVEMAQTLALQHTIQIETSSLPLEYVQADRQRLKQVLLNLITNAIKYNREGGKVFVDCLLLPEDKIRIRIRDTGPGISPELQKRLFVPFERLGAERSAVEGTGLGLSLSKSLIQAMGGVLGVESEIGMGATFWIEFSTVESPMDQSYHPEDGIIVIRSNGSNQTHTILCFEDNISNLQLVEQIFKYRPFVRLIAAMDGKTGLEVAYTQSPDIILLDLNLPDINGFDVIHRLKANPDTQNIPVIVVSADATSGQIQRLMNVGAHAYITKPLDVEKFLQVIDTILVTIQPG